MQSLIKLIIGCILTYHVTLPAAAGNTNALLIMSSGWGFNTFPVPGPSSAGWYLDNDAMSYPNGGDLEIHTSYQSGTNWYFNAGYTLLGTGDQGPITHTFTQTRTNGPSKFLAIWHNYQHCQHVVSCNTCYPQAVFAGWCASSSGSYYWKAANIANGDSWLVFVISYNYNKPDEMTIGEIDYGTTGSPHAYSYYDSYAN